MNSMLTAERLGRWENLCASVMWFSTFFKWVVSSGASGGPAWHTVSSRAMETQEGSMPFSAILPLCGERTGIAWQRAPSPRHCREQPAASPVSPSPAGSGPRCPLRPAGASTHIWRGGRAQPSLRRGRGTAGFCSVSNSCTSCSLGQHCCLSCSAPPAPGVPAPVPFVPVGPGWGVGELMSCPMPGCRQGLSRNQPCPGFREQR